MILVIMLHYEQWFRLCKWFDFFNVGCAVFFVCSGFGITRLIKTRYPSLHTDRNELKGYYFSRFKALAPGWYLTMLIGFLIETIVLVFTGKTIKLAANRNPIAILLNIAFLHGLFPFGNNDVMPGGWYIGATAIFYCLTPLIVKLIDKFNRKVIFFLISSELLLAIWAVLLLVFGDSFNVEGFAYFVFLVHYPEYLFGIVLYYNLMEKRFTETQIKLCPLLGILCIAASFSIRFSSVHCRGIIASWVSSLAAYLLLCFLITNENARKESPIERILVSYGKKSYGIFLSHFLCSKLFIEMTERLVNIFGISIRNIPGFIVMIPVILTLCYVVGALFNRLIIKVSKLVFH